MSNGARIRVIDRETGAEAFVPVSEYDPETQELVGGQVLTVSPTGDDQFAAGQAVSERAIAGGFYDELSPEARAELTRQQVAESTSGGTVNTIAQLGRGALAGATLGLSELALRGDTELERRQQRREREAGGAAFTVGEVVGGIAPALLSGGAGAAGTLARLTPAGRAAALGRGATGVGQRLAATVAEGALAGAGAGVSQLALLEEPPTFERAVGTLGTGALVGAGAGLGASLVGKAVGKGLQRARRLVDDVAAGRGATGSAVGDQIASYRQAVDDANPWIVAEGESRAVLSKSKRRIRKLLDERIGLGERPWQALDPLRREAQVIRNTLEARTEIAAKLAKEDTAMARAIAEQLDAVGPGGSVTLKGKSATRYGAFTGTKASARKGVEVDEASARQFVGALDAGEVQGARAKALGNLESLLEQNEALQQSIVAARDAGKEAGQAIGAAQGYAVSAAAGLLPGGPLGAVAALAARPVIDKLGDLVTRRLTGAAVESTKRTAKVLDTIFKAGAKAAAVAPVVASRALSSASYAPTVGRPPPKSKEPRTLFKRREQELRSQTMAAPDGTITMRPSARQAVADQLTGVRTLSLPLADQLETLAARRIEFLASKLPRRPDIGVPRAGPDMWQPSDFQVAEFARYVAAVEDPGGVEERIVDGSLTPQDVEAFKAVYPERYIELRNEMIQRLATLRKTLPYPRRFALSMFFELPIEPSLHPRVVQRLQAVYAMEPGTMGGTQPPVAKPQFGSISRPEPTPAQERAS